MKHSHCSKQLTSLFLNSKSQMYQLWKWIHFVFAFNRLSLQHKWTRMLASGASQMQNKTDQVPQLMDLIFMEQKGNSNFELGTAICYVNVENYFLTIIKHIAVPSSKLEFPFITLINIRQKQKEVFLINY